MLSRAEFDKMILTYRPDLVSPQLQRLFSIVNVSGSGKISFSEFKKRFGELEEHGMDEVLTLVRDCLRPERSGLRIEEVFRRIDKLDIADGTLSQGEFDKMILTYRPDLSTAQLQKLFRLVNASGSGKITFDEFAKHFRSAPARPPPTNPAAGSVGGTKGPAEEAWAREVLDLVKSCLSPERCGLKIEDVFLRLDDLDKADNTLSRTEFDKMILTYKPGLKAAQLQTLFSLVNLSGSGKITFEEFVRRFGN